MKRYYNLFGTILPQVEAELSNMTNQPQVGSEIYAIPWGHIKLIVDKCKDDPKKALFFVDEVIKEFKSRDIGQIGTYINIVDDIVKMDSSVINYYLISHTVTTQYRDNPSSHIYCSTLYSLALLWSSLHKNFIA